jgi:hypothetical protein
MEFEEQTSDGLIRLEKKRSAQGEVEDESQQYDPYPHIVINPHPHRNDHLPDWSLTDLA